MKIFIRGGLAMLLVAFAAPAAQAVEFSEEAYYAQQYANSLVHQAETQNAAPVQERRYVVREMECVPNNLFVVVPQYFHSRSDKASGFKVGGDRLKTAKSRANGMGFSAVYNRRISNVVSLGFMYEYSFMKVNGGMAVPDVAAIDTGYEKTRYHSHVIGFLPEFDFDCFGKLQLSVIQGFDRPSGTETVVWNGAGHDTRSVDKYGTNVTSLMAWYQKDFNLDSCWTLTPYAGWRSLYVDVKNANVWSAPAGTRADDNTWVHLVSGGLKLGYQRGALGFNVRGGVNHRTSGDDIPGYGNRAVAPGVVHFSHRANQDRTVGTFGAGVSYATSKRMVVSVNYDAFFGRDTSAHMGTVAFALPF